MSDLCHNCGSCHLPRPCDINLSHCDICNNFGHSYNFCPLGVWQKDPSYLYWMLCHNCDCWHLPQPCLEPLHKCVECGQIGHIELFCPVRARTRENVLPSPATSTTLAGHKRTRTSQSETGDHEGDAQALDQGTFQTCLSMPGY